RLSLVDWCFGTGQVDAPFARAFDVNFGGEAEFCPFPGHGRTRRRVVGQQVERVIRGQFRKDFLCLHGGIGAHLATDVDFHRVPPRRTRVMGGFAGRPGVSIQGRRRTIWTPMKAPMNRPPPKIHPASASEGTDEKNAPMAQPMAMTEAYP